MVNVVTDGGGPYVAAPPRASAAIAIDVGRLETWLWLLTLSVLALGVVREIVVHLIGIETPLKDLRQFGLDTEHSLPAWYESFLMVASAGTMFVLASLSTDRPDRRAWTLLAAIFMAMAVDEVVSFHEVTIEPLRSAFDLGNYLYFSWTVLAAPILVALAAFFLPFVFRLPTETAVRFVIAGGIFIGGAFGMELLGGHFVSIAGFESVPYKVAATAEECMQGVGITLFLTSLLAQLRMSIPSRLEVSLRG